MYTYTQHAMSDRDKDGVMVGLLIRAMIKFNKIYDLRASQCTSEKWQSILKEVRVDVIQAFLDKCDLNTITQFTKELEELNVNEFFPQVSQAVAAVTKPQPELIAQEERDFSKPPDGARFYSFRRRARQSIHLHPTTGEIIAKEPFRQPVYQ